MKKITIKYHHDKTAGSFIFYVEGEIILDAFVGLEDFIRTAPEVIREGDYLFIFSCKGEEEDDGWDYELVAFYPMNDDGSISETQLM